MKHCAKLTPDMHHPDGGATTGPSDGGARGTLRQFGIKVMNTLTLTGIVMAPSVCCY